MAERVGFEPTVEFPLHSLSRRALSTAQTPLRGRFVIVADASVAQQRSSCKLATRDRSRRGVAIRAPNPKPLLEHFLDKSDGGVED